MRFKSNTDKGVAGLTILLSLVTMLFVIGLLVMIYSLMGGELRNNTDLATTTTVANESVNIDDITGIGDISTAISGLRNFRSFNVSLLINVTLASERDPMNNTLVEGVDYSVFTNNGSIQNLTADWNQTQMGYDYTFDDDTTASGVILNTTTAISTTTNWFNIFIVIGAMVVLILLTVIIITAIRGSGLMSGGGSSA